jgi:hypothetical protein
MSSVSSADLDLDHPKWKFELIMDNDDALGGDLKELGAGRDALTAQVHKGLRLEERHRSPIRETPLTITPLKLLLTELHAELICELINHEKPNVMSSLSILWPRIT